MLRHIVMAGALALLPIGVAAEMMVMDPYARAVTPNARAGAAFMVLHNMGGEDDRLIAARSDIAVRVELHTHEVDDAGVARMVEIEGGIVVAAGQMHALERGKDHVMLMGLNGPVDADVPLTLTLVFEKAGEKVVELPWVLGRGEAPEGGHKHSD